jgi:hypothetical protein
VAVWGGGRCRDAQAGSDPPLLQAHSPLGFPLVTRARWPLAGSSSTKQRTHNLGKTPERVCVGRLGGGAPDDQDEARSKLIAGPRH